MPLKKPFGITVFASILTVAGGFASVVVIIEMIDSIRFFGPTSLGISSLVSLFGFMIFAVTPILLYSAGVGLFMSHPWARKAVVFVLPFLLFFFFANLAYTIAYDQSILLNPSPVDIFFENTDIFLNVFMRYVILVVPTVYYFTRPLVVLYFKKSLNKES